MHNESPTPNAHGNKFGKRLAVAACLLSLALPSACRKQPSFSIPIGPNLDNPCEFDHWIVCDHVCAYPRFDHDNCGGCGVSCGDGYCVDGTCGDTCNAPWTDCGNNV